MSNQPAGAPDPKTSWLDDLPFPKRWIAYALIKLVVIALAVYLALVWYGLV
ncbi:MAG: hypothetical protein KDI98_01925 [Hyphomicrobiaceae bacterium]|nr:hypothetical protein [Hyphomicrobiaceae bacterium]